MFLISVIMIILFLVIVSKQNKKDKDEIEYLKRELFRAEDKSNYILNKIASKYPEFVDEILKEYYNNQRAGEYSQPDYNVNQNTHYNENAENILSNQVVNENQDTYYNENKNVENILNNQVLENQDIYNNENVNTENILSNQVVNENQEVYSNENVNVENILNNQALENQDIYNNENVNAENILDNKEVEKQDIYYYDTTYISKDIMLVNKKKYKEKKVITKSKEQIRQERIKFNSTLSLCLGAVFIMISGLVFATTTWKILPDFIKLISLAIFAVLFYVASFVAYKKLDIIRTAKTFYVLGSIYVFVFVLAAGYFRLLGEYLSIRGSGRFLLFFIGMFFTEISLIYGLKLFREKWYGYICASGVSICFGLLVYTFTYEIKSLSFYYGIFAVVLIMIDRYKLINRLSQMFEPVKIIYPRYSQVSFILACTMIAAFHRNNLNFAAVMLLLSAVCIFLTYRDRKAEYLPFGLFLIVLVIFKLIHIKGIYELMYKVLILNVMGISLRLIKLSKKKEDVVYSEISENILKFIKYIPYVTCVVLEIFVLKDIYNPYFLVVFSAFMAVLMVIWINLLDNDRQLSLTVNIAFYIFSFTLFKYINIDSDIFLAVYLTVLCVIMLSRRFIEKIFKVSFTKDAKLIDYMVFICAGTSLIMSSTELFLRCTLNSVYYTFLILVNVFLIHKYDLKVKLSAAFNIVFYVFAFTLINYFIQDEEIKWLIYVIVTTLLLLGKDIITKHTKQEFDLSSDFTSLAVSVALNFIFTCLIVGEYFVLDWLSILGTFLVLINVILIHRITLKIKLSAVFNIVFYVFIFVLTKYFIQDEKVKWIIYVTIVTLLLIGKDIITKYTKQEFGKSSYFTSLDTSILLNAILAYMLVGYFVIDLVSILGTFLVLINVILIHRLTLKIKLSAAFNIAFYVFIFVLTKYFILDEKVKWIIYVTVTTLLLIGKDKLTKYTKQEFDLSSDFTSLATSVALNFIFTCLIVTEYFMLDRLSILGVFLVLVNVILIHRLTLKIKLSAAFNIAFYVFIFVLTKYFILDEKVKWLIYVTVATLLLLGKDIITKHTKQEFDLSSDFTSLAVSVALNFIFTCLIVGEYFVLDRLSILGAFLVLVNVILIHRLTLKIKLSLAVNIVIYVFMYTIYRYIGIDVRLYIATVVIVSCIFILTNEIMLRFLKTEFDKISLISSAIVSVAFNINLFFDLYKPFRVFYREDIYSSIVPSWAMVVKSADTIYANIALLISLLFLLVVFIKYKNKILVLKYFDHIIQIGSILICGNLLALGLNIFIRPAYLVLCYIIIYMFYTTYKKESIDKLIVIISVIAGVLDFTNAIYSEYYILTPYLLVVATYIIIKLYFIKPTFEINENSQNLWNRLWIALCLVGIYLQLITTKTFDSYNSIIVLFIVFISFSVIRVLFIKYFGKEVLKSYFDKILIVVFLSNIVCFVMSDNNVIYVFMISFILLVSHAYYYISYNNSFDLASSIMGIPVMILISYKLMDLSANQKFIIICVVLVIICAISRYFYDIYINVGKFKNVYDWFSVFSLVYLIIFVLGVDTKFYSVLLLAISAYIWQYRCIKKFEKPLLTLSLLITTVAFWIQQFVTINKLIVQEYYMLVLAISTFSLKFIYKEEREKLAKFQNAIYTLCIFILGVFAVDEGNVNNAIIYILICIFTFIIAIIYKNKFMRNVGFGFALLTALYMTRDFWLSIGWWAILLVLGILLIVFAATNEKRKK